MLSLSQFLWGSPATGNPYASGQQPESFLPVLSGGGFSSAGSGITAGEVLLVAVAAYVVWRVVK